MLIAHKVIDVLKKGNKNLLPLPGGMPSDEECRLLADRIERAEKFDFQHLPLEIHPTEVVQGRPTYLVPKLTEQEVQFWREGLIPLPAELCWYEFTLGGYRSGVLVSAEPGGVLLTVHRVDYFTKGMIYDGIRAEGDGGEEVSLIGNPKLREIMKKSRDVAGEFEKHIAGMVPVALYLTLMLNSSSSDTVEQRASRVMNSIRGRKGLTPLASHRIVTIVPRRYQYEKMEGGGERRLPRLHWRRSHKRHYESHTLKAKWMPAETHNGKTGWWVVVLPRCLVGKAELGEISHEYRIT